MITLGVVAAMFPHAGYLWLFYVLAAFSGAVMAILYIGNLFLPVMANQLEQNLHFLYVKLPMVYHGSGTFLADNETQNI